MGISGKLFAVGATALAAAALTACGGSGTHTSSAAAGSPSTTTSNSAAPTTTPTTSAARQWVFTGSDFRKGLLPVSVMGSNLRELDGYPKSHDTTIGQVAFIRSGDCGRMVAEGGEDFGSFAQAHDAMSAGQYVEDDFASEHLYQDEPGDATKVLYELRLRIDGDCHMFDYTSQSGLKLHDTAKEHAVSGIGDEAMSYEVTESNADGSDTLETLDVRYGDVLVSVTFDAGDPAHARAYDLRDRVAQIAAKLNLKPTGS